MRLSRGDIGYLIYLHGVLYAQEYEWDYSFEAYVAAPLAKFARLQNNLERIWMVEKKDNQAVGFIAIVEASSADAQLRWLLLHPTLRGQGIGKTSVKEAISFCREKEYSTIFLWTVSASKAASGLYKSLGFQLTEETTHTLWGTVATEQRYELWL